VQVRRGGEEDAVERQKVGGVVGAHGGGDMVCNVV
jgi:hypothetical protein